ncbi:hypothetical protein J3R03_010227 [Actinoplanes couchii]|uniref:Uncharacterized protein n=1 Tax=Actinoplanes couchii TaxID=403638 RepID=A0ABQ3X517_9ACTN|nr:hypothetical protein [Actinoplanes couchii]GID53616.1 hypothetical protein Aco03nite_020200 [Actinoplanes couchii]
MGYWARHPKKDLEDVLQTLHEHGYQILNPPKYYTVRCSCGAHQRQVHLTPSSAHYANHVVQWARNKPCW